MKKLNCKKIYVGLLTAAFCFIGEVNIVGINLNPFHVSRNHVNPPSSQPKNEPKHIDNPFEIAEDELYNGRFVKEKVDLRLESKVDEKNGRFFVGDLKLNGISHLVLAKGVNGALIGTMGEVEDQSDGGKKFSNEASTRFQFQRQEGDDYLLQIGENQLNIVLKKQTFPELKESYCSQNGLSLIFTQRGEVYDGNVKIYAGNVNFRGCDMPFAGQLSAGILQGNMTFEGKTYSFVIESGDDGSLVFLTGGFRDELILPEKVTKVDLKDVINALNNVPQSRDEQIMPGKSGIVDGRNTTLSFDDVELDMIWIESGSFTMGSPRGEEGRLENEKQHKVTLTKGYWMGKYEVTQEQYKVIMGENPSKFAKYIRDYNRPVEQVSWDDAMEFCRKLTDRLQFVLPKGYKFTLPTEAQWEYACRAGTATAFNNGTNIESKDQIIEQPCSNLDELGWYNYNSDNETHLVELREPNAWGLYDMHGNVWEWCLDYCDVNDGEVVTDTYRDGIKDPLCAIGSSRIIRGGAYNMPAGGCRSAYRYYGGPGLRSYSLGFRVCLSYSSNP